MDKSVTIYPEVKTTKSDFIDGFLQSAKWQVHNVDEYNTPVVIIPEEKYIRIRETNHQYQYIIIVELWPFSHVERCPDNFGADSISSIHFCDNTYKIFSRSDTPLYQYCETAKTKRNMPKTKSLTHMLGDFRYSDYKLGLKIGIAIADAINEQNYRDTLVNREEEFNGAPS